MTDSEIKAAIWEYYQACAKADTEMQNAMEAHLERERDIAIEKDRVAYQKLLEKCGGECPL